MEDDAAAAPAEIRRREGDRHATAESEAYIKCCSGQVTIRSGRILYQLTSVIAVY
jgi:hypothetical protein